jgi:hypothetical protein
MAVVNLKTILPNDSQVVITDKINYNFDQLLTAGGGPPGDVGLTGNPGIPGMQGIQGFPGVDGAVGNKWYVGFGTPPPQTDPPTYVKDDLFLSNSDNYIWQFDGNFWFNTGLQLAVSGGEFKSNTFTPANSAVLLQSPSKNLVISSLDYDLLSMNPNSVAYNSKLKVVGAPGVLMELGLDLGGSENPINHVTFEIDGSNGLFFSNNGGGTTISATGDINISNASAINLKSTISVWNSDAQYFGTIVNAKDIVNKEYLDSAISALSVPGSVYDSIRIGGSWITSDTTLRIKPTGVFVNQGGAIATSATTLTVSGNTSTTTFSGPWDHANPAEGQWQKKGKQLECWGRFAHTAVNTQDITFTKTFPVAYGTNNIPVVNLTVFPTTDVNESWTIKNLSISPTGFSFKIFYTKRAVTTPLNGPSTGFVDYNFATAYTMNCLWHAVGSVENVPVSSADSGVQLVLVPPVT